MNQKDLEDIQIQLLTIAQAIESGQAKGELLRIVADTLDLVHQKTTRDQVG